MAWDLASPLAEVCAPSHPIKYSQVGIHDSLLLNVIWVWMKICYLSHVVFTWYIKGRCEGPRRQPHLCRRWCLYTIIYLGWEIFHTAQNIYLKQTNLNTYSKQHSKTSQAVFAVFASPHISQALLFHPFQRNEAPLNNAAHWAKLDQSAPIGPNHFSGVTLPTLVL